MLYIFPRIFNYGFCHDFIISDARRGGNFVAGLQLHDSHALSRPVQLADGINPGLDDMAGPGNDNQVFFKIAAEASSPVLEVILAVKMPDPPLV